MGVRLLLSRLASAPTRNSAGRGLAVLCGIGFLISVLVLAARGGIERWFFVLLVWALFVYAPLRIVLEAAGTLAPALRKRLAAEAAAGSSPLASSAGAELMVDRLLDQEVVMPRIATPAQREKARDGAMAVLAALRARNGELAPAVAAALGCLDYWVADIGPWAQREAGQNIQARWRDVRAFAAMAAMTKVLAAVDHERHQTGGERTEFLDACLDYCDELALEIDVRPWDGPALHTHISESHAGAVREAWRTYAETGAPALDARKAFVDLLLQPPQTATP